MSYDASNIKVLEGLEAVRIRPSMYIGSTDVKGLNHLVYELIDNSIDEASNGYGDFIRVALNEDGSCTVEDHGRGIPVDKCDFGVSALRTVLTTLHAGGKFDNNSYKTSGGLHGVGSSVVNALSERFYAEVNRDGKTWVDEYNRGIPTSELEDGETRCICDNTLSTGTSITFLPDSDIFDDINFDAEDIKNRLHELAYLNSDLTLLFQDDRIDPHETTEFHEPNGMCVYLDSLTEGERDVFEAFSFSEVFKGIEVSVALKYIQSTKERITGFCNNIQTQDGGTHISAFKSALTNTINQYARQLRYLKDSDSNFLGADVRSGLVAVIVVKHPDPQFEGQTKTKLNNKDITSAVMSVCSKGFEDFFDRNLDVLKSVLEISKKSANLRKAEVNLKQHLFDSDRKKKFSFDSNGKLANCESKDPSECELFIVEGDSAAGSGKMARDRRYQAILPIRGKILNVEKASMEKVLANEEIKTLVYALGCGFLQGYGNDFDISRLKFDKIIIMADGDVDGFHISTLLLTLFYRMFPELIEGGHVYISNPPLYKVIPKRGDEQYLYDDRALEQYSKNHSGFSLQRYKGLGEMSPNQLWETTMNPESRILTRVLIEHAEACDLITRSLMGDDASYRKSFISEHALEANIDV